MTCNDFFLRDCSVIEATSADVQRAFQDLNRDMDPEFTHVFLDKIERYASKPDRALFLVEYKNSNIAFATIINKSPLPETLHLPPLIDINDYACGTGLMVLKEYRRRGVASLLVKAWERWAMESEIPGVWVITHKMSQWYQSSFAFELLGTIITKGVHKSVLAKNLLY